MSLDERIHQLSLAFVQELHGPIEASLRQLLVGLIAAASEEREAAVRRATAEADARHRASIDALRTEAAAERDQAVEEARASVAAEREAALAALRAELGGEHEAELEALGQRLAAEHEIALSALGARLDEEHEAGLASLRQQLTEQHEAAVAALRDQLQSEHAAASAALVERLDAEHEAAVAHALEQVAAERDTALAALREQADAEREGAVAEVRDSLIASHAAALSDLGDRLRADHSDAIAALQQRVAEGEESRDAARAEAAGLAEQLRTAQRRHDDESRLAAARVADAHTVERQAELACTEGLLDGFRRLDEATSLTRILGVLTDQLASVGRAATFLLHGGHLRGWRAAGIDGIADADIPLDRAGLLAHVVESGHSAACAGPTLGDLAPFLAPPPERVGLALPLLVGGRVVAIVYVDDAGAGAAVVPSAWPETAELLARHAGRCLEMVTVARASALATAPARTDAGGGGTPSGRALIEDEERRAAESARRYARLLISEIKLYNQAAVDEGRRARDLLARLAPEIERARRLYRREDSGEREGAGRVPQPRVAGNARGRGSGVAGAAT